MELQAEGRYRNVKGLTKFGKNEKLAEAKFVGAETSFTVKYGFDTETARLVLPESRSNYSNGHWKLSCVTMGSISYLTKVIEKTTSAASSGLCPPREPHALVNNDTPCLAALGIGLPNTNLRTGLFYHQTNTHQPVNL